MKKKIVLEHLVDEGPCIKDVDLPCNECAQRFICDESTNLDLEDEQIVMSELRSRISKVTDGRKFVGNMPQVVVLSEFHKILREKKLY